MHAAAAHPGRVWEIDSDDAALRLDAARRHMLEAADVLGRVLAASSEVAAATAWASPAAAAFQRALADWAAGIAGDRAAAMGIDADLADTRSALLVHGMPSGLFSRLAPAVTDLVQ